MAGIEIRVEDHGLQQAAQRAPQEVQADLAQLIVQALVETEGTVVRETPVGATGHLRQSITHDTSASGLAGRVYATDVPLKVASVEHGRAPGRMPPRAPIELWVRRKLGLWGPDLASAVFLIRRAIGRRGTPGRGMFQAGAATAQAAVARRLAALRAEWRRRLL